MEILSRETQDGSLPHHIGLDLHLLVYALFAHILPFSLLSCPVYTGNKVFANQGDGPGSD